MTTIDLECPHCGRVGSVPVDMAQTRIICRKCHLVFHMTPGGQAVPGDPPRSHAPEPPQAKKAEPSTKVRPRDSADEGSGGSNRGLLIMLGTLGGLLLMLGIYVVSALRSTPVEVGPSVLPLAQEVAEAFLAENLETVKRNVLPATTSEAVRFYEESRPKLKQLAADNPGVPLKVNLQLVESTPEDDEARIVGYFVPDHGSERAAELARAARLVPLDKPPTSITFWWARGPEGDWKLDGKKTAANPLN